MQLAEALQVVARHRGNHVVIATMASIAEWPKLSDSPLDLNYLPSSMGLGLSLGLGLALAQQRHGVIVLSGDGSLLMHLGSLVTIAAYPANLYVLVLDNGIYEVTGGQAIVGAGLVDYEAVARAVGFKRAYSFKDLSAWEQQAPEALTGAGPVLASLQIEPRLGQKTPKPPRTLSEQLTRLASALVS